MARPRKDTYYEPATLRNFQQGDRKNMTPPPVYRKFDLHVGDFVQLQDPGAFGEDWRLAKVESFTKFLIACVDVRGGWRTCARKIDYLRGEGIRRVNYEKDRGVQ